MAASLDFCCTCGCWIGADTGTMREGADGQAEIICAECLALKQNVKTISHAEHDTRNGSLIDL